MGKRKVSRSSKKTAQKGAIQGPDVDLRLVDVARVRFQHSRIRPVFSGCGRSVEGTLESIRRGEVSPHDLPPIQVSVIGAETVTSLNRRCSRMHTHFQLVGCSQVLELNDSESASDSGHWYFSLNNRRLWVLKRCREEGLLLPSNLVRVRVRQPRSAAEIARYTVQNCALEASLMREPLSMNASTSLRRVSNRRAGHSLSTEEILQDASPGGETAMMDSSDNDISSSDDASPAATFSNRYSAFTDP